MDLHIGCTGWNFKNGVETGYYRTQNDISVKKYSQYFDCTEINSTFHSVPKKEWAANWYKTTPDHFKFTAKLWKGITHENPFYLPEQKLEYFFTPLSELKEKLTTILIQIPNISKIYDKWENMTFQKFFESFKEFTHYLPEKYHYAVEARNKTWYNQEFYDFLREKKFTATWLENEPREGFSLKEIETTDIGYIRIIGGHNEWQKQKHPDQELNSILLYWKDKIEKSKFKKIYAFINQNFSGNAMRSASEFKEIMGFKISDQKTLPKRI